VCLLSGFWWLIFRFLEETANCTFSIDANSSESYSCHCLKSGCLLYLQILMYIDEQWICFRSNFFVIVVFSSSHLSAPQQNCIFLSLLADDGVVVLVTLLSMVPTLIRVILSDDQNNGCYVLWLIDWSMDKLIINNNQPVIIGHSNAIFERDCRFILCLY
jgi:hypothetical protein